MLGQMLLKNCVLTMMIPFIQLRTCRTNLPSRHIEEATPSPTPTTIVDCDDPDENEQESWMETPTNAKKRLRSENVSEVTGQEKWSKKKKPDLDKEELRVLKSMQKAFECSKEESKKDDIDLFGMLVSAELRKLGEREQRMAKNQI
eukprot:gene18449-20297_t